MQIEITPEYLTSQGLSKHTERRFYKKVRKTDSCWIWIGSMLNSGYGRIQILKKFWLAHRVSFTLNIGPIPDGLCVLHDCPGGDNRACVNPDHLWLGTVADNNRDRNLKNPLINVWSRKLSKADVEQIRASEQTQAVLAGMYGVAAFTISQIIRFKKYKCF